MNLITASPTRRYAGLVLLSIGVGIVGFSLFWVRALSHPPGLSGQLLFILIGVILGGPMIGYGGTLLWGDRKHVSYISLVSGIDYIAIVLFNGWAVTDIFFLVFGLAALGGSYRYLRLTKKEPEAVS